MAFQPMNLYDAPWSIMDQVTDGSASFDSVVSTLMDQGRGLTPEQRENWFTRTAESIDESTHPLVGAAFRTATNPFVLLAVALGPVGGIGSPGVKSSARLFNDKLRPSVVPWGLRTGNSIVHGTGAMQVSQRMAEETMSLKRKWVHNRRLADKEKLVVARLFNVGADKVKRRHLKQFANPDQITDPALRARVKQAHVLLGADQLGADMARARLVKDYVPQMHVMDGARKVELNETQRAQVWNRRRQTSKDSFDVPDGADSAISWRDIGIDKDGLAPVAVGGKRELITVETITDEALVARGSVKNAMARLTGDNTLQDFSDSIRMSMADRYADLFLKDGVTAEMAIAAARSGNLDELVDTDAIMRMVRPGSIVSDELDDSLARMLSPETHRRLRASQASEAFDAKDLKKRPDNYLAPDQRLTMDELRADVSSQVASGFQEGSYLPRTNTRAFQRNLKTGELEEITDTNQGEAVLFANTPRRSEVGESGRSRGRVADETVWADDDLDTLAEAVGGEPFLTKEWKRAKEVTNEQRDRVGAASTPTPVLERGMSYMRPVQQFERQTARDYLLFRMRADADGSVVNAHNRMVREYNLNEDQVHTQNIRTPDPASRGDQRSYLQEIGDEGARAPAGGWSNADLLEASYHAIRGSKNRLGEAYALKQAEVMREAVVPAMMGHRPQMYTMSSAAVLSAQQAARHIADTDLMKDLSKDNDILAGVRQSLHQFADQDHLAKTREMAVGVGGILYSSHLGLNLGSAIMNAQQPFLLMAPWAGARETAKAYKEVMGDFGRYAKERHKYVKAQGYRGMRAVNLTGDDRLEIARRAGMEGFEEAGLSGNVLEDLDSVAHSVGHRTAGDNVAYWTTDAPLKLFEKVEWMNRLVSTKVIRNRYRRVHGDLGRLDDTTRTEMKRQMELAAEETQFGATAMNSPMIFNTSPLLRNPLIRQFTTFPIRTLGSYFEGANRVGEGARQFRWGTTVPLTSGDTKRAQVARASVDFLGRAVGISAALYYGAGGLGLDFERGGSPAALGDAANITEILGTPGQTQFAFRAPPAMGIPLDMVRSLIQQDGQLAAQSLLRLIPGGVAATRLAGAMSDGTPIPLMDAAQRQYVEWDNLTPDGRAPVFRANGSFVGYENPIALIMQGLGVPLAEHKKSRDMDRYLSQQRTQIIEYRTRTLNALLSNRPEEARRLNAEFQKKFGLPLTFTQAQVKGRLRSRTVGRTERMLDRLPSDQRGLYQEAFAEAAAARSGTTAEDLANEATARKRARIADTKPQLDQESVQALRDMMKTSEGQRAVEGWQAFNAY